jgi:hypothetical protein
MLITLEDWKNGWYGVDLGFDGDEIEALIELLEMIKDDANRHFHASSEYKEASGIGQVTFWQKTTDVPNNAHLTGRSARPGERVPE